MTQWWVSQSLIFTFSYPTSDEKRISSSQLKSSIEFCIKLKSYKESIRATAMWRGAAAMLSFLLLKHNLISVDKARKVPHRSRQWNTRDEHKQSAALAFESLLRNWIELRWKGIVIGFARLDETNTKKKNRRVPRHQFSLLRFYLVARRRSQRNGKIVKPHKIVIYAWKSALG